MRRVSQRTLESKGNPFGIYPEGVRFPSEGSRSAPWKASDPTIDYYAEGVTQSQNETPSGYRDLLVGFPFQGALRDPSLGNEIPSG